MKLALGSYRINGIPKFAMSASGSKSMRAIGPQMRSIRRKVKAEVRQAVIRHLRSRCQRFEAVPAKTDGAIQPTPNPSTIAKKGTPMPIPTAKRSRRIKAMMGKRNLRVRRVDIDLHSKV